jgi:phosphotriesterase-related protein
MTLLNRRDALALLGAAGGAGLAAAWGAGSPSLTAFGQAAKPAAAAVAFPKGAVIRTLLKDLPPEALAGGPVLFHEHLSMHYPPQVKEHFTDDVAMMVEEVRAAGKDGIACIVDGGHPDMTRSLDALKRIAAESGVAIVASGGYYMQRTYPPEIATRSADQIADDLVRDAAAQRLGAFGEIGQQGGVLTDDEKKVFQAVAKAHVRTGLPVFTHNAYTGTRPTQNPVPHDAALRQLDVLEGAGAKPSRLAIGHICCLDDPKAEVAQQLAKRGAFVGFDRVTIPIVPDAERVVMIMAMVEAGYADHVLLSSDFAVAGSLKKNGGAGIGQAATVFGPMLLKAGMPEATLHRILVDNPRRFLAFVPA